jgi:hypothetical protein
MALSQRHGDLVAKNWKVLIKGKKNPFSMAVDFMHSCLKHKHKEIQEAMCLREELDQKMLLLS